MPKNLDSPVEWAALGIIVLIFIIGFIAIQDAEQALDDPNDKSRIYIEQLPSLALLAGAGTFQIIFYRQSGNIHTQYEASTALAAVTQAMTTFRRAKIDAIRISRNTSTELHFNRLFYSHRGASKGKKVGSVQVTKIA